MRRFVCKAMACMAMVGCFCINAAALDKNDVVFLEDEIGNSIGDYTRASNSFTMDIAANGKSKADKAFSLEAGETVEISAVYSPKSASVDFGLIDSDGVFHYINVTDGSIDETIQVNVRGNYTFAVRNNSVNSVRVIGFMNY